MAHVSQIGEYNPDDSDDSPPRVRLYSWRDRQMLKAKKTPSSSGPKARSVNLLRARDHIVASTPKLRDTRKGLAMATSSKKVIPVISRLGAQRTPSPPASPEVLSPSFHPPRFGSSSPEFSPSPGRSAGPAYSSKIRPADKSLRSHNLELEDRLAELEARCAAFDSKNASIVASGIDPVDDDIRIEYDSATEPGPEGPSYVLPHRWAAGQPIGPVRSAKRTIPATSFRPYGLEAPRPPRSTYEARYPQPSTSSSAFLPSQSPSASFTPAFTDEKFSVGSALGELLPMALKQQVWNDEFVDLYKILYPKGKKASSLALNTSGGRHEWLWEDKKSPDLPKDDWLMAWNIYSALYLRAFPDEAHNLLFYCLSIQKLMKKGANWRGYDHDFREQKGFWHYPWTTSRVDLSQQALMSVAAPMGSARPSIPRFQGGPGNGPAPVIPSGYCFAYHARERHCSDAAGCSYSHKCPIKDCGKTHPKYLHPRTPAQKKSSNHATHTSHPKQ